VGYSPKMVVYFMRLEVVFRCVIAYNGDNFMNKPTLSIIIPIYNVENYLTECLSSVCVPTPFVKQIFLVNDGSTDGCATIIRCFAQAFPAEVEVITQANAGLSSARNRALAEATGQFVIFVDSDDYVDMSALVCAVHQAKEQQLELMVSPYYQQMADNKVILSAALPLFKPDEGRLLFNQLLHKGCYTSAVWCYVWQRSFLNQHNLWFIEGQLHEDLFFTFKALLLAQRAGTWLQPFYFYRLLRVGAITQVVFTEKKLSGLFTALALMEAFLHTYTPFVSPFVRSHLAAIALEAVHKIALLPKDQRLNMRCSFTQQGGNRFISQYGVQGKYKIARFFYGVMPRFYMRVYRWVYFYKNKRVGV
jgi:glycosyltransferase involved in cell wall biosynthesis